MRAPRHDEDQHPLPADRSAAGRRQRPDSAIERARLIQQPCTTGLASTTVREVRRAWIRA